MLKIYVLAENDKIYRYNLDGSNEEHFAGDGNGNVNGDLLTAKFSSAYRISHYNGDIYIGEEHGHRVKIIRGISGGSNNIENIKTKNGKVCIKLGNPVNYDKNNISITYTKNTDISKNLFVSLALSSSTDHHIPFLTIHHCVYICIYILVFNQCLWMKFT